MDDEPVPDEQNDERPDRRADKSRALIEAVPADRLTDERGDESPGDAEDGGQDKA